MKKTLIFFSMAALALMGIVITSCTSENTDVDQPQQPVNNDNVVTLTTTVSLDANNATTRALDANGVKTFAAGDQIAFIYKNTSGQTVKAVSSALPLGTYNKTATFTVTLTNPQAGAAVRYIYPAAMVATSVATDVTVNDDATINYAALNSQNGTLATLSSSLDLAVYDGTLTAGGNLPASPKLVNKLAICEYTIKDNAATPNDITSTVTAMTISDGNNTYSVSRSAAVGPIYVVIRPTSMANINYFVTAGGNNFTKSVTGKTYEAGNMYQLGLRMSKASTDLSMVDCAGNARASRWTANCYMVHTAGDYKLPLVYGNAIKNGAANPSAYTGIENASATLTFPNHAGNAINAPWITKSTNGEGVDKGMAITVASAELLWQDAKGLITNVGIDGDYLTVTVGKDADIQEGNALVAVKDGDGTIVWSWHIWVTKQTFSNLTNVDTGSHIYQLTPVNLGWVGEDISRGYCTYYQWGRKDAFAPSTGAPSTGTSTSFRTVYNINDKTVNGTVFGSSSSTTIADNIKKPKDYNHNSGTHGPCNTVYFNMWDAQLIEDGDITTATVKTVYDPCPPGFCVPTSNLYTYIGEIDTDFAWDETNKGRKLTSFSPYVFFPAAGYHGPSGLQNVGGRGNYWSSTPGGYYSGTTLYFVPNNSYRSGDYRHYLCSVRAVAEE